MESTGTRNDESETPSVAVAASETKATKSKQHGFADEELLDAYSQAVTGAAERV
jgi:hypothetical protein